MGTCEELCRKDCKKISRKVRKWLAEGKCPKCGELGKFMLSAPVCSIHGPYVLTNPKTTKSKFDSGDCWQDDALEKQDT